LGTKAYRINKLWESCLVHRKH